MPPIYIYITTCSERVSTTSVPLIQMSGTQVSSTRTRVSRLQSVARVHTRAATELQQSCNRASIAPTVSRPSSHQSCNIAATELQQSCNRASIAPTVSRSSSHQSCNRAATERVSRLQSVARVRTHLLDCCLGGHALAGRGEGLLLLLYGRRGSWHDAQSRRHARWRAICVPGFSVLLALALTPRHVQALVSPFTCISRPLCIHQQVSLYAAPSSYYSSCISVASLLQLCCSYSLCISVAALCCSYYSSRCATRTPLVQLN